MAGRALVTGAAGFLGSHVVRRLLADGRSVRAFVKPSSNVAGLAGLPIDYAYGDVLDPAAVSAAMDGCDAVYHCVVNTQAWLRDPAPMYRVNVDGLVHVMDAALAHGVRRFIFTSTIATIAANPSGVSTEKDEIAAADKAGDYILCRWTAERRFFEYVRERGLPGIAMNVANTYGPGDHAMTPHGRLLAAAAFGQLPFAVKAGLACVGIDSAADAMVLAETHGRVGQRYIVSERWLMQSELYGIAADQAGRNAKIRTIPIALLYAMGFVGDCVSRLRRRDSQLSVESARLSHIINDMDSSKARAELGWSPEPVELAIRAAVDFYKTHRPNGAA